MTTNTAETSQEEINVLLRRRVAIQKERIADLKRALLECAGMLESETQFDRFVKLAEEL